MSVDEAQPGEEATRGAVRWVVPGEQRIRFDGLERIVDDTGRRLERVALPPMTGRDMHTEFGSAWMLPVWSETAAADVLPGGEEEDWPVLNAGAALCLDLALETGTDLSFRKLASRDEPSYRRITPERACKWKVGFVPPAETEA